MEEETRGKTLLPGDGDASPHHDDRHSRRGAAVFGCCVEVRLQFSSDLHLHVVCQVLILHTRNQEKAIKQSGFSSDEFSLL